MSCDAAGLARIARKDLSENGWHFNFIRREDEQDEKVIKVKRATGKREKGPLCKSSNKLRNHKINYSQAKRSEEI